MANALRGTQLSERDLQSCDTRVSINQLLVVCRNAARFTADPHFAFHAGLRCHFSTFGMFGFAMLSSLDFRKTIDFGLRYQRLAAPLVDLAFKEERGRAIWTAAPLPAQTTVELGFQFLSEFQFAILLTLHRDVMGPEFVPMEVCFPFPAPADAEVYPDMFGCPARFGALAATLSFDSSWLDREPRLGDPFTHAEAVKLCDDLIDQLRLRAGIGGKVREVLLVKPMLRISLDSVAKQLHMTERTLRRKLHDEKTSFRKIIDELRMHVAIRYLRDTDLSIKEVADSLGFSEDASFRHAFRRWTQSSPLEFRNRSRGTLYPPVMRP
jgi:AraC-like DNA-binding protein